MHTIEQDMKLDEKSFFGHVVYEDMDAIMYDIREAHKTYSMTADEGSVSTKDTGMDQIQQDMDSKTGAEFLAKQFCDAMRIFRGKASENEKDDVMLNKDALKR